MTRRRLAAALAVLPLVLAGCSASVDGDGVQVDADLPTLEVPDVDVPTLEVPDVEVPSLDVPDLPEVEVSSG